MRSNGDDYQRKKKTLIQVEGWEPGPGGAAAHRAQHGLQLLLIGVETDEHDRDHPHKPSKSERKLL